MTVRKLFYRTAAILLTAVLLYVWLGIVWLTGGFQPWVYELAS